MAAPVILITGASSGIGEATALLFARHGYRVVLAARRMDRLEALAAEIRARGGEALPVEADVTRQADIQRLVDSALEAYRQIDILFNNAGFGRLDWLENLDPDRDIEAQLRVNLLGVILVTRLVLPHMIARRSGHIINMGSIAGLVATPTFSIYAASKFGMRGFTDSLRREVGVYGIKVSAIYPGGVWTEFSSHTGGSRKTRIGTPSLLKLEASQVAEAVLGLARHPRRSVVIPWPMQIGVWLAALFPGLSDWIIGQVFVRRERGLPARLSLPPVSKPALAVMLTTLAGLAALQYWKRNRR